MHNKLEPYIFHLP